jgi:hypothetical protein
LNTYTLTRHLCVWQLCEAFHSSHLFLFASRFTAMAKVTAITKASSISHPTTGVTRALLLLVCRCRFGRMNVYRVYRVQCVFLISSYQTVLSLHKHRRVDASIFFQPPCEFTLSLPIFERFSDVRSSASSTTFKIDTFHTFTIRKIEGCV